MSPYLLIALPDGLHAGRQRDNQVRMTSSRIGFRHPGKNGGNANLSFADGHRGPVGGEEFPRGLGGSTPREELEAENMGGKPTVHADPLRIFCR